MRMLHLGNKNVHFPSEAKMMQGCGIDGGANDLDHYLMEWLLIPRSLQKLKNTYNKLVDTT